LLVWEVAEILVDRCATMNVVSRLPGGSMRADMLSP